MSNNSNIQRDDALLAKLMKIIITGNLSNLPVLQQTLLDDLALINSASVALKHDRFKDFGILLNGASLALDWHYEADQLALKALMNANFCRWELHLKQKQAFLTLITNTQESAA